ncbi:hypothetical protein [Microbacterium maritypicum]|uniref:hypothetical protein n=1 Tax=Microbacterium maritypicum TaxID=33918 RepID=UPI001478F97F|nr:hypothetical protein [Microbacterium liquefaciens]
MEPKRQLTNGQAFLAAVVTGHAATLAAFGVLAKLGTLNPMVVEAFLRAFGLL